MQTSENGLNLIKFFEGLRLKPYRCSANKATLGYGSTFDEHGNPITMEDLPISKERAEFLLKHALKKFEHTLNNHLKSIDLTLNQNEFDACVCFIYNLGSGLLDSSRSFGAALKTKDRAKIADSFLLYNKAGGKIVEGLKKRREAERELFIKEI